MKTTHIFLLIGGGILLIGLVYWLTRPRPTAGSAATGGGTNGSGSQPDPTAIGAGIGSAIGGLIGLAVGEATNQDRSASAAEAG